MSATRFAARRAIAAGGLVLAAVGAAGAISARAAARAPAADGGPPASRASGGTAHPLATVPYLTREGDTLYEISTRYLQGPGDWPLVARLNGVPAPKRLQRGVVIRLPAARLRRERLTVRVVALHGAVERAGRDGAFAALGAKATLGEGDRLRTGSDGFVTLELSDGTHLSLPPDSQIDLTVLRRTVLTGVLEREFELRRGSVDSEVTHLKRPDDRFQIRAPSVVAGVRGTRFRVGYDDGDGDGGQALTRVEVLDGAVGVEPDAPRAARRRAAAPGATLVHANFGSVTRAGGQVGAPVPLLEAPRLARPGKLQDDAQVDFEIVPLDGARAYHVELASDAGLLDLLREVRSDTPRVRFSDLPDGRYFVRIAALDANGLEGQARVYGFERRRFGLRTEAGPAGDGYAFRWNPSGATAAVTRYRFILSASRELADPIVDQPGLTDTRLVIAHLPPGRYYWTVIAEQFVDGRFYDKAGAVNSFTLAR
ncbi:peptidase M23 [Burkholderia glumae AU6208]|nr:FecR domain-containing protein [Burkholderia glumae]PJO20457.1 peptidase M23 [Burkholderia glumae AU6208]QHE09322.1 peptidase M23 [Burkholderia glumae AU6208]